MSVYDKNGNKIGSNVASREEAYPILYAYYSPLSITVTSPCYINYTEIEEKEVYTLKLTRKIKDTVIPTLIGNSEINIDDTVTIEVVITVENGVVTMYDYTINTKCNEKDLKLTVTTRYTEMEYPTETEE